MEVASLRIMESLPGVSLVLNYPDHYIPTFWDCVLALPAALVFICLRAVFERCVMRPLALAVGLTDHKVVAIQPNEHLEKAYRKWKRKVPSAEIKKLSSLTSMTEREIDRWFHWRRKSEIPSMVYKFSECGWHCTYYTCSFVTALYFLWDKSWLWDTREYFKGYPNQFMPQSVFWMYQCQVGFYLSLLFSMAVHFDSKRKDRLEMFVHHIVTLGLILGSWSVNYTRVGSVVMLVHDMSDPLLMLSKMVWYTKKRQLAEIIFGFTILIWTASRLMMYPLRVVRSVLFEGYTYIPMEYYRQTAVWVTYWVCAVLLCVLQVLHILWTYSIVRVVMAKFQGQLEKDVRSESESDDAYYDESPHEQRNEKPKTS